MILFQITIVLISRFLNIVICSKIANVSRETNKIDTKKQFFLWFAGVRGAMAFALSLKSRVDFNETGNKFLIVTLIITSFTLLYSSFLLQTVLIKSGIITSSDDSDDNKNNKDNNNNKENKKDDLENKGKTYFDKIKAYIGNVNELHLIKKVHREKMQNPNNEEVEFNEGNTARVIQEGGLDDNISHIDVNIKDNSIL